MNKKIKAVIIDDDREAIKALEQALAIDSGVSVEAFVQNPMKAKNTLLEIKPDVVFMDIEMPGINGFEILNEVRPHVVKPFLTVFYSAYEKYTLKAIKESAFDYLLKPVNDSELKKCITRLKDKLQNKKIAIDQLKSTVHLKDIVSLPTATGIRFARGNEIILIKNEKENGLKKSYWHVILNNEEKIRLRAGITSTHILNTLKDYSFLQINQSTIVNLSYISNVEIKTRQCKLMPPYQKYKLCISRGCMTKIREMFDDFSVFGGRL